MNFRQYKFFLLFFLFSACEFKSLKKINIKNVYIEINNSQIFTINCINNDCYSSTNHINTFVFKKKINSNIFIEKITSFKLNSKITDQIPFHETMITIRFDYGQNRRNEIIFVDNQDDNFLKVLDFIFSELSIYDLAIDKLLSTENGIALLLPNILINDFKMIINQKEINSKDNYFFEDKQIFGDSIEFKFETIFGNVYRDIIKNPK